MPDQDAVDYVERENPETPAPAPFSDVSEVQEVDSLASSGPGVLHVAALALALFDQTCSLHGLGEESRRILEQAALLCRKSLPSRRKKLPRAALHLAKVHAPGEFPEEERSVLAAVLAVLHGRLKRKELKRLELSSRQLHQVFTLVALLRIAVGCDHSASGQTTIRDVVLAPEGVLVVLEGPQADVDAQAARHNARLWKRLGYPAVKVMEAKDAAIWQQPFPEVTKRSGILPDDLLAEAGRKVMCYHFAQMLRWEEGTRLGEDIEALHRMRVATRRLRAAFEVFEAAFEPGVLNRHLKGLRATGRCLGKVRDLDVFLEKARHYQKTLPEERCSGLAPLLASWQEQRDAARLEMLAFLDSPEYALFRRKFNIFLHTPGAGARQVTGEQPAPQSVRDLVPVLIYTRMAAVRAYQPFLRDAPVERLHALRIEFKKLRYTVEYFEEVLGKRAADVIEAVKNLQDHLGDLNDAQVATHMLNAFVSEWEDRQAAVPIPERQSIEEVVNYQAHCHAECHQRMRSFPEAWRKQFANSKFRRGLASAVVVL